MSQFVFKISVFPFFILAIYIAKADVGFSESPSPASSVLPLPNPTPSSSGTGSVGLASATYIIGRETRVMVKGSLIINRCTINVQTGKIVKTITMAGGISNTSEKTTRLDGPWIAKVTAASLGLVSNRARAADGEESKNWVEVMSGGAIRTTDLGTVSSSQSFETVNASPEAKALIGFAKKVCQ